MQYIQDGILNFSYHGGTARFRVVLSEFFPASSKDLRILMRTIDLNSDRDQIAQELLQWLCGHYSEAAFIPALKECANACTEHRTKAKEMAEPISRQAEKVSSLDAVIKSLGRGHPIKKGMREKLKKEKEKLKDLKEKQRGENKSAKYYNGRFIKLQAKRKRAEKNIGLMREWEFKETW